MEGATGWKGLSFWRYMRYLHWRFSLFRTKGITMTQPILESNRLILRPFALSDGPAVQRIVGIREVAANTLLIPHPYEDGMAEEWIASHPEALEKGETITFAVVENETGELCGAISLHFA